MGSTDEFLYNKIAADVPEQWLSADVVLRCRKMRELGCTKEMLSDALRESHLETRWSRLGLFVRRRQPLPPFVGREHRTSNGLLRWRAAMSVWCTEITVLTL